MHTSLQKQVSAIRLKAEMLEMHLSRTTEAHEHTESLRTDLLLSLLASDFIGQELIRRIDDARESGPDLLKVSVDEDRWFRVEIQNKAEGFAPVEGYEQLFQVLMDAHDQAAKGKGKERHANDLPFHEQRMQQISTLLNSPDGMAYQVAKKVAEGLQMPNPEARDKELLGAIVYTAGILVWLRNQPKVED